MDVYNYNPATGEYVGTSKARIDPLESEKKGELVWLIPAHATMTPPPVCGASEKSVFSGGVWSKVRDFRGAVVYDRNGHPSIVSKLGDLPVDVVTVKPPAEMKRPSYDGEKWVDIYVPPPPTQLQVDLEAATTIAGLKAVLKRYMSGER